MILQFKDKKRSASLVGIIFNEETVNNRNHLFLGVEKKMSKIRKFKWEGYKTG